jgi:putative DNA primase/helicase
MSDEREAPVTAGQVEECSDLGNARRFIKAFGDIVRWVEARGEWLYYPGVVWTPDQTLQVERFGQIVVQAIFTEAAVAPTPGERKDLAKHAMRSQSARAIRDMLQLARAHLVITPAELDADPYALAVQNGVLELKTDTIRDHRREDFITKLLPVAYDPDATCPTWEKVLERIMGGRTEMITYLQKIFGYALTGDVREQSLFIFHGAGSNGKSTIVNAVMELLGPHAAQLATDVLLARGGDAMFVLNQLASIEGRRLVAATEADLGKRMAEATIKQLCSGDRIKVRRLFHEPYEITPTWTIILSTNHKPRIKGRDHAIWRRLKLVPFDVTIAETDQDRRLPEKLRAELPGILAWAVRGCQAWLRDGMGAPDTVRTATAGYQDEEDTLGGFLLERCVLDPAAIVKIGELYDAYVDWCKQSGETALTKTDLGRLLNDRGYLKSRAGKAKTWFRYGLRLKTLLEQTDQQDSAAIADPAATGGPGFTNPSASTSSRVGNTETEAVHSRVAAADPDAPDDAQEEPPF